MMEEELKECHEENVSLSDKLVEVLHHSSTLETYIASLSEQLQIAQLEGRYQAGSKAKGEEKEGGGEEKDSGGVAAAQRAVAAAAKHAETIMRSECAAMGKMLQSVKKLRWAYLETKRREDNKDVIIYQLRSELKRTKGQASARAQQG
uniref:Uncharacterized protein n=1 Tax=Palpitomonas bilix TaxID=652834 RepID=A0A7S3LXF4_9EUKA